MSAGNTFENDIQKLIFNGTPIAGIADNAAAAPLTNLFLSLHTADPGEAGTQQTSECAYVGYARAAVLRTGAGFVVTNNQASPAANIDFPPSTSGPETAAFFAVGTAASGAGKILISGSIAPSIAIGAGVTPRLTTGTVFTLD